MDEKAINEIKETVNNMLENAKTFEQSSIKGSYEKWYYGFATGLMKALEITHAITESDFEKFIDEALIPERVFK